jgi:hypothetical protein
MTELDLYELLGLAKPPALLPEKGASYATPTPGKIASHTHVQIKPYGSK